MTYNTAYFCTILAVAVSSHGSTNMEPRGDMMHYINVTLRTRIGRPPALTSPKAIQDDAEDYRAILASPEVIQDYVVECRAALKGSE